MSNRHETLSTGQGFGGAKSLADIVGYYQAHREARLTVLTQTRCTQKAVAHTLLTADSPPSPPK